MKAESQQHIDAELRGLHGRIDYLKERLQGGGSPGVKQILAELHALEKRRQALTANRRSTGSGSGRVAKSMLEKTMIDLKAAARAAYAKIRK